MACSCPCHLNNKTFILAIHLWNKKTWRAPEGIRHKSFRVCDCGQERFSSVLSKSTEMFFFIALWDEIIKFAIFEGP